MARSEVLKGRKREDWPEDSVLLIDGVQWTLEDVLGALLFLFENEDRHKYPGPRKFRGAAYLLDAIRELEKTRDLDFVIRKYGLFKPSRLHEFL